MIHYLSTEKFASTIRRMVRGSGGRLDGVVTSLSYEELFFERAAPIGHYIFTDFDRLTRYELDTCARFTATLAAVAPQARIYNHPLKALERYPLLLALHRAGINDFSVIRLDGDARPARYPVFIRTEDGFGGPETDLIRDDAGFDAALAELDRRGLSRRGRIAVGYAAEPGADGFFRKYGAFNIGGRIVPFHIQRGRGWVVKQHTPAEHWIEPGRRVDRETDAAVAEELAYVRDNPHAAALSRAFEVAGIDFGRADYGIVGGKVQIYEINLNPHMTNSTKQDARAVVRGVTRENMLAAIAALDTPLAARGRISFPEIRPRAHALRLPYQRLHASLGRRLIDLVRRPVGREE